MLIKVKSCSALLRTLLVCICSYLKSVLRYQFLILDACHTDILYLHEQGCKDPWLFFEIKRGPLAQKFGEHCPRVFVTRNCCLLQEICIASQWRRSPLAIVL